jgi:flavin reductase (DIM6/NTAB) family NADH-FMN oxidoreductase RutF
MPHSDPSPPNTMYHTDILPAILYWGTPVVLITTMNPDNTPNIQPMSSAFWLGYGAMLGLDGESKTTENLLRTKQCVLNLASDNMAGAVNALARTTGSNPVPESKVRRGYQYVNDKFGCAGLTPMASRHVAPPGILECPVSMEAEMVGVYDMFEGQPFKGHVKSVEVKVLRVSIHDELRLEGYKNRIDADRWKPMIMMFCELYGLKDGKLEHSRLADIKEEMYRGMSGTKVEEEVVVNGGVTSSRGQTIRDIGVA